jgi:hypothetical protein
VGFKRLDLSSALPEIPGRWGGWVVDWETLTLTHREGYCLHLEEFRTAAAMLNMIVQVRGKVYMTPTDVGDLVVALDDLFEIQGSLTPSGVPREISDVREHLERRRASRGGGNGASSNG